MSDGRLNVQYFAANERVKAFDSFDEVASGNAQIYHAAEYYWKGKCCFADYLITDLPDYFARWGRGFPTVFRDRRKMGRLAGCRTGVGAVQGGAPSLRSGPTGARPPCARRSVVSAA